MDMQPTSNVLFSSRLPSGDLLNRTTERDQPSLRGFRLRRLSTPCRVELPGFQPLLAGQNSVLLLGPGDAHEESPLDGVAGHVAELPVPTGLLAVAERELGVLAAGNRRFRMPIARLSPEAYFRWRLLDWSANAADRGPEALEAVCRAVLLCAANDWRRRPVPNAGAQVAGGRSRFELAQQAAALIEMHWQEGPCLEALAAHFELSSFHLLRSFRRGLGLTPHQYLLQIRLRRSFDLLEAGGLRIIDIALATGFSSHGHYSTAFRKTFGISPLAYQRLGRAERGAASA
ncbi:helix-turn-helix transcriptional regulator [Pseudomarimonas salicorniae]|uniref:AraC family transcriptional regulator n=1 Tax=Pseudomarimonas salicorniae TaxID=2933270 RepID=A0ABT0GE26_9GAMM|nr:AraC family transcriptional regulator [Lysobacter sp. CAU 1642]MCK7592803.1 AraC family transcriptional regulator [Lysobacter sp. CAU 1642]